MYWINLKSLKAIRISINEKVNRFGFIRISYFHLEVLKTSSLKIPPNVTGLQNLFNIWTQRSLLRKKTLSSLFRSSLPEIFIE